MYKLLGLSISVGIIANLDNLGIGVSYGLQKIRIPFLSNLLIAAMSLLATALAMITGTFLSQVFPLANLIGALLLIALGIWIAFGKILHRNLSPFIYNRSKIIRFLIDMINNPEKADRNTNGVISLNEAIIVGISLSLNCIVTGLGAGLSGLSVIPVTISVFVFSLITLFVGYELGTQANSWRLGHLSQIISGILLVAIGIRDLI